MDRFRGARDYISNMNRSLVLVVGLIVVVGLIAASFIYGDTNGDLVSNDDNGNAVSETTTEENGDGEEATDEEENGVNGEANGEAEEEELPGELADTGAALPAAGMILLGAGGYLYRRSRKQLEDANKDS